MRLIRCVRRIIMGTKWTTVSGWLVLVLCASFGIYQAQAQNCAQKDCVEINYGGSAPNGGQPSCFGYCNDSLCVVVTHSCAPCSPALNVLAWCLNQDASKICCQDVNVWGADCSAGTCTLQCANKPVTVE